MKHPSASRCPGPSSALPSAAGAASVTIAAGQTYALSADLTMSRADTLDANGTPSSPCIIVGDGHAIVANSLTGHVKIQNCAIQGLRGAMETTRERRIAAPLRDSASIARDDCCQWALVLLRITLPLTRRPLSLTSFSPSNVLRSRSA
jgi:hypothetical protein